MTQKVVFYIEKTKSSFDGTFNSSTYAAMLCPATDNSAYTFKKMLQQPDYNNFLMDMIQKLDNHKSRSDWKILLKSD